MKMILMDRVWLEVLENRLEERRQQIAREGLQPDRYPPFPECPECSVAPDVIRRASDDHFEAFLTGAVVTRFEPCGHLFRVDHSDREEWRP